MKVAVAQFESGWDKEDNLEHMTALAEQASRAGAQVVVFPEGAMHTFGENTSDLRPAAEPLDGPFVESVAHLASRLNVTVVAGMFETIAGDDLIANTAVVLAPRRGLVASHRKVHLYDAFGEVESERFQAGTTEVPLFDVDGFKAAFVVCYELRFPAFIQDAADRGADMLLVSAAWVAGPLKEEHWMLMVRARAIENTMYVAGAGMTGARYCGRSMIVDPLGVVEAGLAEEEGVTVADVSRERIAHVRARLPLVRQRRLRTAVKR